MGEQPQDLYSRVRGGIYGVAIGDALGATLEFRDRDTIKAKYGVLKDIIGGGWLDLPAGRWTDDADMTLAVAEGIIEYPQLPVEPIGDRFYKWYQEGPADVGSIVAATMEHYKKVGDWYWAAELTHSDSKKTAGNGSLMRTLPIAFAYGTAEKIYQMAKDISRITHWDLQAGLCCAFYSLLARELLTQEPLAAMQTAWERVKALTPPEEDKALAHLKSIGLEEPEKIKTLPAEDLVPRAYVILSLKCALWAFLSHGSLEEVIIAAVNLGGDADSIGAIAGGLAGTYWGFDAIPQRWLSKFDQEQIQRLDLAARGLWKLAATSSD